MLFLVFSLFFVFLLSSVAYAHCPVCNFAIASGLAVTRFYGVDDLIVGLWLGAFLVSSALWLGKFFKRFNKKVFVSILTILFMVITFILLYFTGVISNNPNYLLFGIDKLLIGSILGIVLIPSTIFVSNKIKERNGKALFPFQTITFVLIALIITSVIIWII